MISGGAPGFPKRYCREPSVGEASLEAQTEISLAPVRHSKTTVFGDVQKEVRACFAAGGAAGRAAVTRATVRVFVQSGFPWHSSANFSQIEKSPSSLNSAP